VATQQYQNYRAFEFFSKLNSRSRLVSLENEFDAHLTGVMNHKKKPPSESFSSAAVTTKNSKMSTTSPATTSFFSRSYSLMLHPQSRLEIEGQVTAIQDHSCSGIIPAQQRTSCGGHITLEILEVNKCHEDTGIAYCFVGISALKYFGV
jgi:hypothetical protein